MFPRRHFNNCVVFYLPHRSNEALTSVGQVDKFIVMIRVYSWHKGVREAHHRKRFQIEDADKSFFL